MSQFSSLKCVACRSGEPPLDKEQIAEFLPQVPDWQVIEVDDIRRLQRTFRTKDFVMALALTQGIGEIAEEEGHHPLIITEWGRVTVQWWTHKIKGLHRNDFIMAAKTDEFAQGQSAWGPNRHHVVDA